MRKLGLLCFAGILGLVGCDKPSAPAVAVRSTSTANKPVASAMPATLMRWKAQDDHTQAQKEALIMVGDNQKAFEDKNAWPSCEALDAVAQKLLAGKTVYSMEKIPVQYQLLTGMGCSLEAEGLSTKIKSSLAKLLVPRGEKVDAALLDDVAAYLAAQSVKTIGTCEHKAMIDARSVGRPLPEALSSLPGKCKAAGPPPPTP